MLSKRTWPARLVKIHHLGRLSKRKIVTMMKPMKSEPRMNVLER